MQNSLSFDRAAGFYDATRELPEAVARRGIPAILEAAGPKAAMLEVGTGTGRISIPLLNGGANVIGCDLSLKMMAVLQQKLRQARLVQADACLLPFPSGRFQALITCHVMHLVGPWRAALKEYRRLLEPQGVYINARTEQVGKPSIGSQVEDHWKSFVQEHGASPRRPGVQSTEELHQELVEMGSSLRQVEVVHFTRTFSIDEVIQRIADRIDSPTWTIPDPILKASIDEVRAWTALHFRDLSTRFEEESAFILDICRFQSAR